MYRSIASEISVIKGKVHTILQEWNVDYLNISPQHELFVEWSILSYVNMTGLKYSITVRGLFLIVRCKWQKYPEKLSNTQTPLSFQLMCIIMRGVA
jgi:hypothetical protein